MSVITSVVNGEQLVSVVGTPIPVVITEPEPEEVVASPSGGTSGGIVTVTFPTTTVQIDTSENGLDGTNGTNGINGVDGQPGTQGPPGPQGPQGVPGGAGYLFTQNVPATQWFITHNMATFPVVTVVDSANQLVIGNVDYTSTATVTLSFGSAFSGVAYLI